MEGRLGGGTAPKPDGKFNLENIHLLLERLGNPQKKLQYVHVAGTNGKGSTAALIASILKEAKYKTGLYTSPFLSSERESIAVDGQGIGNSEMAELATRMELVISTLPDASRPSEFERLTALAFLYFYERGCEVAVLETGLGGRLDATNVIDASLVSVITSIGYDHTDILGDTLSQIAWEKAGIIKQNGCVVLYPQEKEAEAVIERVCRDRNASLSKVDFNRIKPGLFDLTGQSFGFEDYQGLRIKLLGAHQLRNASLAIKTVEELRSRGYQVNDRALRAGLRHAKWAGRFEVIHRRPIFIVDGAHNPQGADVLAENLRLYFPGQKCTFIVGVLADKDYEDMVSAVLPLANQFITVTPDNPRALPGKTLADYLSRLHPLVQACESIEAAVETSLRESGSDGIICAFGSLYYIGRVRASISRSTVS